MGQKRTDLLRGTLDLLVLKALSAGALARSWNLSTYHANHQGSFSGQFRFAFSGTTPHGGKRLGRSRVALVRQQPPRKILPVDFCWARSAQG